MSESGMRRLLIGFAGGMVGGLAMNLFARAARGVRGGLEAPGASPGGDRDGRGAQPPQAVGRADADGAVKVGTIAYRSVTGEEPARALKPWLGTAAHYAFSGAAGAVYMLAGDHFPALRRGRGTYYGSLVWAFADETMMPALGLSRAPSELAAGVHAYSLASHLVWGATLDTFCRTTSKSIGLNR